MPEAARTLAGPLAKLAREPVLTELSASRLREAPQLQALAVLCG